MTFKELYQKLSSRVIWGNLLAMALLTVVLVISLIVYLSYYTHHGESVIVPDVKGQTCEAAIRQLQALGLRAEVTDTGHITSLSPDIILDQSVEAGRHVKQDRMIRLTVNSAQAKTLPLPNVVDGSLREAQMKLQAMGFRLGTVKRIEGDYDLVYRVETGGREIYAGSRVSIESPIVLVVGDGGGEDIYNGDDSAAWAVESEYQELEDLLKEYGH